jgi:peroxiredoxin
MAPAFEAETYDGKAFSLESYRGAKLWLSFYRFASCPLCNYRIQELIARYDEFTKAGIRLVGVMQSPAENIAKYTVKQEQPFPLIADPERELYDLFGVTPSFWAMFRLRNFSTMFRSFKSGNRPGAIDGKATMVPADFLIDPEGVIWEAYYGAALSDHLSFERVTDFAADDCLSVPAA